jgi:hypothetical protein
MSERPTSWTEEAFLARSMLVNEIFLMIEKESIYLRYIYISLISGS